MPKIYFMSGVNFREGKATAYQAFLKSKAFKKLSAQVEAETGARFIETYGTIFPSSIEEGDYDAYEFWELPNLAALDKVKSAAVAKLGEALSKFFDPRPVKIVFLRKFGDVKILDQGVV